MAPDLLVVPSLTAAATFMEHWKRKQMRLNYRWDLTGFEEEEVSGFGTAPPRPLWCPSAPPRSHYFLGTHTEAQEGRGVQARLLPAYSLV